jgi:hypothetical protein
MSRASRNRGGTIQLYQTKNEMRKRSHDPVKATSDWPLKKHSLTTHFVCMITLTMSKTNMELALLLKTTLRRKTSCYIIIIIISMESVLILNQLHRELGQFICKTWLQHHNPIVTSLYLLQRIQSFLSTFPNWNLLQRTTNYGWSLTTNPMNKAEVTP